MKKKLFICFLLIGNLMGNVMAQDIITNLCYLYSNCMDKPESTNLLSISPTTPFICIGELKETPDGNQAATPCPKKL